jgi:hypothetical protein
MIHDSCVKAFRSPHRCQDPEPALVSSTLTWLVNLCEFMRSGRTPKNIQKSVTQRTKMVTVSKALQHDLRQRDSVLAQQLDTAATCGSWCIMIYLLLSGNRHSRKINCYFQSFLNSCEVQKLQRGATVSSLKTKLDLTNLLINKFNKFTNLS